MHRTMLLLAGMAAFRCAALAAPPEPIPLRYPVVLVHGILSFHGEKGDYFNGVLPYLRERGVRVSAPQLGAISGIVEQAQILRAHILKTYPDGKIHIVAHSLGGLVARYIITTMGMGNRVASLTTVGTPHRGTLVADWVMKYIGHGMGVEAILRTLGISTQAIPDLMPSSCAKFNIANPDDPRVRYFSFGGYRPWHKLRYPLIPFGYLIYMRQRSQAGLPVPDQMRDYVSTQEWGPAALEFGLRPPDRDTPPPPGGFKPGESDGVVPVSSTPWGESFTRMNLDHLGQIGWHVNDGVAPRFYESLLRRLVDAGF